MIAGRLGGIAPVLAALGIDASDAGLAEGEAFEIGSKLRPLPQRSDDAARLPLPGGRVYVPKLDRSFSAKEFRRLADVPNVREFLVCDLPCCRYSQLREAPGRGHAHALWARRDASARLLALPRSMRVEAEVRRLETIRSNVVAVNHSLSSADEAPIDGTHVERHLGVLHRVADEGAVAA